MKMDFFVGGFWAILAFDFLLIGMRGLVTQRPFLVFGPSYGVPFLLYCAAFVLMSLTGVVAFGETIYDRIIWWVIVAVLVSSCIMVLMVRGYWACGVTDRSFREGLSASLTKLKLTYEETPIGIWLPTIAAYLEVTGPVSLWHPFGTVSMKDRHFDNLLADIAKGMNEYYRSGSTAEVNLTGFKVLLLWGVLFALYATTYFVKL